MANKPELEHFNSGYLAAEGGAVLVDCPFTAGPGAWERGDWVAGFLQYHQDQLNAIRAEAEAIEEAANE